MINKILIIILCIIPILSKGQFLTGSADDKSSIVLNHSNVAFNTTQGVLSATYSNVQKLAPRKKCVPFLSIQASGKSADSLSNLFSSGEFLPSATLNGIVGVRFFSKKQCETYNTPIWNKEAPLFNYQLKKELSNYIDSIRTTIDSSKEVDSAKKNDILTALDSFKNYIGKKKLDFSLLYKDQASDNINGSINDSSYLKPLIGLKSFSSDTINLLLNDYYLKYNFEEVNKTYKLYIKYAHKESTESTHSLYLYVNGGFNTLSKFMLYDSTQANFSKRFPSEGFTGGFVGVGVNLILGAHWVLGLLVSYEKANTFDSLTSNSYTLTKTDSSQGQQLSSSKNQTAYLGKFQTYDEIVYRTDAVYYTKISTDSVYLVVNPYTKLMQSFNSTASKSSWDAGCSLNLFKMGHKFLGGVYAEFDNIQSHYQPFQNFVFGIVTKFSFDSILQLGATSKSN